MLLIEPSASTTSLVHPAGRRRRDVAVDAKIGVAGLARKGHGPSIDRRIKNVVHHLQQEELALDRRPRQEDADSVLLAPPSFWTKTIRPR